MPRHGMITIVAAVVVCHAFVISGLHWGYIGILERKWKPLEWVI